MKFIICLILILLASMPLQIMAQASVEELDWTPFDLNKNDKLDGAEQDYYVLHQKNAIFRKYDVSYNGQLEPDELMKYGADLNEKTLQEMRNQRSAFNSSAATMNIDLSQPQPAEVINQLAGIHPTQPKLEQNWYRLRGKVTDFSKTAATKEELAKIDPAIFALTHNFAEDSDTWSAKGAIGGYWGDTNYGLSAGAEFERLSSSSPSAKEVDSLVFKVLGSGEIGVENSKLITALGWTAGANYATNFDFDGGLLGAELEIEPLWNHNAFSAYFSFASEGSGRTMEDTFTLNLRNYLRVEGGGALDDFPEVLPAHEEYLRIGPVVEATIFPFGTQNRVSLKASYGYYAEVLGDGEDFHLFKSSVDWRLDEIGHYAIRLEYVNGLTPLLLQEQETLLLSLSVRF